MVALERPFSAVAETIGESETGVKQKIQRIGTPVGILATGVAEKPF